MADPRIKLAEFALNGQPAASLIDPYGTPYAYFAAVNGRPGVYAGHSYTFPGAGTAYPVTRGGKFLKEKSFQILSAGRDKVFGGGTTLPMVGAGDDDWAQFQETKLGAN